MKNIIICLFLIHIFIFMLPAIAKNNKEFTLRCSYITARTDFYVNIHPITFKQNGDAYMDNKYIGKAFKTKDNELYLPLEKGGLFTIDLEKWLSIYSILVDDEYVYSYGSCQLVGN